MIRDAAPLPIPQLRSETDACEARLKAAVAEVLRTIEGERIAAVNLGSYFAGGIETEEQLDAALAGIRARMIVERVGQFPTRDLDELGTLLEHYKIGDHVKSEVLKQNLSSAFHSLEKEYNTALKEADALADKVSSLSGIPYSGNASLENKPRCL